MGSSQFLAYAVQEGFFYCILYNSDILKEKEKQPSTKSKSIGVSNTRQHSCKVAILLIAGCVSCLFEEKSSFFNFTYSQYNFNSAIVILYYNRNIYFSYFLLDFP